MPLIKIFSKKVNRKKAYAFIKFGFRFTKVLVLGSYIQRLAPMFEMPKDDEQSDVWLPQKVSNIFCVLEVCIVVQFRELKHSIFSLTHQRDIVGHTSFSSTNESCTGDYFLSKSYVFERYSTVVVQYFNGEWSIGRHFNRIY